MFLRATRGQAPARPLLRSRSVSSPIYALARPALLHRQFSLSSRPFSASSRPLLRPPIPARQPGRQPTPAQVLARHFRATAPRRDVFFVAFPALKAQLLALTRWTLLLLPFVYRYRMWRRYPRFSLVLFQIPVFAICLVLALGLDQSPRTNRWRLLLMSEREELEWARRRFDECIAQDGPLLVAADDPRVAQVHRVCERLVAVLDDVDSPSHYVSAAATQVVDDTPEGQRLRLSQAAGADQAAALAFKPSCTAQSALMPFRPESANPTKQLHTDDWRIYVVDLPRINAFALPTREIFVYTGIINLLEDDTLLAGVLAHEIAHVTQRHAVENAGFVNIAAIAFDIIRGISYSLTISFPLVSDMAGSFINLINDHVADRAYSRKLEMEADVVGLSFMAKAGYNPSMALDLWDAMAAVEEDAAASGQAVSISDKLPFLRTHPTSLQRQKACACLSYQCSLLTSRQNIEKYLPQAMKYYEASPFRRRKPVPPSETEQAASDTTGKQGVAVTPASA
ncbi:hypothetical protein CALCODRAFT_463495 [Calocera cornea HHB12733]|uniref:Peptidase M48 domain-containing protein n=1 Tax=Calocera cornea HHB12733 TaxID=1353952 RepID=A0A165JMN5_9BASI|nr:hypothetical protein CALCODRAFT_463495 [Calocera cornea HHB12733]